MNFSVRTSVTGGRLPCERGRGIFDSHEGLDYRPLGTDGGPHDRSRAPAQSFLEPGELEGPTIVVMTTFDPTIGTATRWKKGQPSPNPGGRPKSRLLSEALRERLAESKSDDPSGRTFAEVIAENLVEIACSKGPGAVAAMGEIADRCEGKARQEIAVSDVTRQLREKSDEELKFYLEHGHWPEDAQVSRQSVDPASS